MQAAAVPAAVLSPASLWHYAERGFAVLPQLCNARDVEEIRATLARFFRQRRGRDRGRRWLPDVGAGAAARLQATKSSAFAPELLRTEYFRQLARAARQLLGPDARFSFDHSVLKPAHSAAATPWHQDEAHHDHGNARSRQVSFWTLLPDTTAEGGCMRYVPGSDRGPLLPHRWRNDDPRVPAVECRADCVDESLAIAMPIAAGSCIAYDGRTLHSMLPNVSAEDQLAYIVAFEAPPT